MNGIELKRQCFAHRLFCTLEESQCSPCLVLEGDGWLRIVISHATNLGSLALILASIPPKSFQTVYLSTDAFNDMYIKTLAKHLSTLASYTQKSLRAIHIDHANCCIQIVNQEPSTTKTIYILKENLKYFKS